MQREHVVMLTGEDFVAGPHDQPGALIVEPLAGMIRGGGGFLQYGVCRDHLAGNQICPDAKVLERALGLGAPQFIDGYLDHTETVALLSHPDHVFFLRIDADLPPAAGPVPMGSFDRPRKSIFPDSPPLFNSHVKSGRGDNRATATGLILRR
jgi:hypothetical protein